jgi:hypothetical protein
MLAREEVWMRAFCAYVSSFNARTESGLRAADDCLKAFDERFPPSKPHEAHGRGMLLADANPLDASTPTPTDDR